jgi:probable F420-dependent oxidoreductase
MELGRLGVWSVNDGMTAEEAAGFAQRIEAWGYGTQWLAEAAGRNVFVHAAFLLARTTRLNIASGIANIYARDPMASVTARNALAEQSGGRFICGLGVSHAPLVEGWRGQPYGKPVTTMRRYLEAMNRIPYGAPPPPTRPKTLLAALGPRMTALAGDMTDGAHPANCPPEHTAQARAILGPGKLLCPEQIVLLEKDPAVARRIGRRVLTLYLGLQNYINNWVRLGFEDADFSGGGSDRLVDAVVAWGDEAAIRARIQAHWDAGADHVCVQAVPREEGSWSPADEKVLELLAPARA